MTDCTNRRWLLDEKPNGRPNTENFTLSETAVPSPGPNEVLVKTLYVSVDPYMRGRMGRVDIDSDEWEPGDVVKARGVGEVVDSNHESFESGDVVFGYLDWVDYKVMPGEELDPVDPGIAPVSTALGVLGASGRTAYHGILDVARPKPGDQVVVSGAAGAVGSVAGQIGKMCGARVTGIAGSERKTSFLTDELGFDEAVNYKDIEDVSAAIAAACSDGVDVYFDYVGGPITDAVMELLNSEARVAVCGQISLYNAEEIPTGPRHFRKLIYNEARVEGFRVASYDHKREKTVRQLASWIHDSKIVYRETITEGLEQAPEAFVGLFDGENIGKQLVKVGAPSTTGDSYHRD